MDEEKVYCSMYSRNAELYHHGIKGQKWGVQNGPPYPLGSGKGSSRSVKEKHLNDNSYKGRTYKRLSFNSTRQIVRHNELIRKQNDYYNKKMKRYDLESKLRSYKDDFNREYLKTKEWKNIQKELEDIWTVKAPKYIRETEDPDDIRDWESRTKLGKYAAELSEKALKNREEYINKKMNDNKEIQEILKELELLNSSISEWENSEDYKEFRNYLDK